MQGLAYTLGVFALILVLARLKVPLALAIFAGAIVIAVLFGLGGGDIARATLSGVIQPRTIALAVVTLLLLGLSSMMQSGGQLAEIVFLAKAMLRRPAVAMAALPALIGLLPMPGGALFSAPMVESAAGGGELRGAKLSAINYWYRHIWEYFWPLYPGVLLALSKTQRDYWHFAVFQLPLSAFMIISGLLLFRRTHPDLHSAGAGPEAGTWRKLLKATSSIWVIIAVWVPVKFTLARWVLPRLPEEIADAVGKYAPVAAGLAVSIVWTAAMKRMSRRTLAGIFSRRAIYMMAVLVVSVMIFQYVLERVKAPEQIAAELEALRVPLVLVVGILPFIAGMVTGLAIGFVGTSFPIVLGLVAATGETSMVPYVPLAYAFGHLGQMLSPLHLCHVVSNEYFKTSFGPVYRQMLPSAALTAMLGVAYFVVLRAIMG